MWSHISPEIQHMPLTTEFHSSICHHGYLECHIFCFYIYWYGRCQNVMTATIGLCLFLAKDAHVLRDPGVERNWTVEWAASQKLWQWVEEYWRMNEQMVKNQQMSLIFNLDIYNSCVFFIYKVWILNQTKRHESIWFQDMSSLAGLLGAGIVAGGAVLLGLLALATATCPPSRLNVDNDDNNKNKNKNNNNKTYR